LKQSPPRRAATKKNSDTSNAPAEKTQRPATTPRPDPGLAWNNGYIESFNNRLRKECLNRNHWNTLFEARVVIGDFKHEHNHRHRHSALGYQTPAEYAAACSHIHTPVPCEIN
jgi:transposase InsO family protein